MKSKPGTVFPWALLIIVGCHREPAIAFDTPTHFKNNAQGRIGDTTFTVRMLPKLIVSGPQHEIEQAQIDVVRGADHASLHVDTQQKSATFAAANLVFELDYADVYHDDIELQVHHK